jgi:hypothetical protein
MAKSGMDGAFVGWPVVEYVDGNVWKLVQDPGKPFSMVVDGVGAIEPTDGFYFDFASIPPVVRWFYPKSGTGARDGRYGPAAIIHDWLYSYPGELDRRTVDKIFLLGMEVENVRPTMRSLFYRAVRVGGRRYFGKPDRLNKLRGT